MILAAPARAVKSQFVSDERGVRSGNPAFSELRTSNFEPRTPLSSLAERAHGREGEPEWREQLTANGGE